MAQTNKVKFVAEGNAVSNETIAVDANSIETWTMTLQDGTVVEKKIIVVK